MRTLILVLFSLLIASCTKDSEIFEPDETISIRNNETDFNFILRATHHQQEVEVSFGDGIKGKRPFRANVKVFANGKVLGKAFLGTQEAGLRFQFKEAITECVDNFMVIILRAETTEIERGKKGSKGAAVVTLQSSTNNTDNPDCVIWEIKDSDGSSQAQFSADGNIFIGNSTCSEDPR